MPEHPLRTESALPCWTAYYIDPVQPNDGRGTVWRQSGGTYWTPETLSGTEALQRLLPSNLAKPVWAFAHAMPSGGAWYDLHYPAGVERQLPAPERPLGPHVWVPRREVDDG